ncbi:MAG: hypothetical protein ACT4PT_02265, partial [Methanobacteriota archaeon]
GSKGFIPGPTDSPFYGAYNAVNTLRMKSVKETDAVPCGHDNSKFMPAGGSTAHPNADAAGDGESHHHNTPPIVAAHTHPTATTDLYWGPRPIAPLFPCFVINDLVVTEGVHTH